ncbi:MAG: hypothetical protein WAL22_19110 [Solirubrobacteraceae bacterium]
MALTIHKLSGSVDRVIQYSTDWIGAVTAGKAGKPLLLGHAQQG